MTADTTAFLQTMTAEAVAVQQFVNLLKLEQTSLSNGNIDNLPEFAEQKSKFSVHLSSLAEQRNTALAAQGLATDRAGIEAWCTKHPEEQNARKAWQKILALASEARELNRLNGELIQMRLQYISKALEALQSGNKSLDLYGPDGQSTTLGNRRIYGAA